MAIEYKDEHMTCDEDGVTIHAYAFPVGSKRMLYGQIQSVEKRDMGRGPFRGRWRIWGSGDFRHWFHLDTDRPNKRWAYVMKIGGWVRPVVTPEDPERWERVLREKGVVIDSDA